MAQAAGLGFFTTESNLVTNILLRFQPPRQCQSEIMELLVKVGTSKIQNSRSVPYKNDKKANIE